MARRSKPGDVVVGPIVRYVDQHRASIWVELAAEAALLGTARSVRGRKRIVESEVARTVEVFGHHYAMVYFEDLDPETLYTYSLDAVFDLAGHYAWPREIKRNAKRVSLDLSALSLGLPPSFSTLPGGSAAPRRGRSRDPSLRLAFGSCRCFGGGYREGGDTGPDVLGAYSEHLAATAGNRLTDWPHLLLLLGDQIYADNVAHDTGHAIYRDVARPKRRPPLHPDWTVVDERIRAGKIAASAGSGEFHLYSFNDFARTYRDAWTSPAIRRLFASVPTFMLPDDHDFTDDFLFSGSWLKQLLEDPPWRTTLANAMLAYWLYQGWGNVWRDAARAHPFLRHVMAEAEGFPRHHGGIGDDLYRRADRVVARADHAPAYYTIPTTPPIIAIDARTDRRFKGPAPFPLPSRAPSIIVGAHPEDELLSEAQFTWLASELGKHDTPIVLSSIPILQTPLADRLMVVHTRREDGVSPMIETQSFADGAEAVARDADAETWFAFPRSLNRLLRLLAGRKTTYVLSGDVHYSYVYDVPHITYVDAPQLDLATIKAKLATKPSRLVNIVCSPLQNEWSDAQVAGFREFADNYKVDENGDPVVDFVTPQLHPWRDAYGEPWPIWNVRSRPVLTVRRTSGLGSYGTRNCIAYVRWNGSPLVVFYGSTPTGVADVGQYPPPSP